MKKHLLFFLIVNCQFLIVNDSYAQNNRIDSLQKALQTAKEDTNKVNTFNAMSRQLYLTSNYDTALYYAGKAKILAEHLSFQKGIAEAYRNIGNASSSKGNYAEALKNHFAALNIYEATGDNNGIAGCYNNIGNVYTYRSNYPEALKNYFAAQKINEATDNKSWLAINLDNIGGIFTNQGNYPEALKNFFAALNIYESIGDKHGTADDYNNIGIVYNCQGNYPEAMKNYFAALKIDEAIGDKNRIAGDYANIGNVYAAQNNYPEAMKNYFAALKINEAIGDKRLIAIDYANIGNACLIQGNYPEALKNDSAALKIFEAFGDKQGMAACYNNIGYVSFHQGNYPEALKSYFAALRIAEAIGTERLIATLYNNIGAAYTKLHRPEEGKKWLQKGLALSKETGAKEYVRNAFESLSSADSALGNYKTALENYKMYILYQDSLYNEENTKKLTQTAMQYEFDKKELADSIRHTAARKLIVAKLQKQRAYTWSGAGAGIVLLAFLMLIFRNNKKLGAEKQKSESLLLNILPEAIAAELKQNGNATAKQFDNVTVLFTDFASFTQTAEKLGPQQLVQELNECFTAFDNIIERNGLEKIKTIGDAYLAVCGLPAADPRHAQKTIQAALAIRDFIAERRKKENVFEIRIGIHTGSVVAGIVGVKKFAYDIWGDTVNTAARMEQSSPPGKINISETTYDLVKDDFACEYRGEIDAKGKGKVKMYFAEQPMREK